MARLPSDSARNTNSVHTVCRGEGAGTCEIWPLRPGALAEGSSKGRSTFRPKVQDFGFGTTSTYALAPPTWSPPGKDLQLGSWANSETSITPQEIQPRLERCFLWLGHACNPGNPGNRGNAMVAPTHAPFHWVMCNPGKAMAVPSLERSRGSLHGSARLPKNAALVSLP